MKNKIVGLFVLLIMFGCDKSTAPEVAVDSTITAKEMTNDVLQKAKVDFASDAKLASIYGWNVNVDGKIDLLKTDNAFVYIVQSSSSQQNEFYVPVFATGPVKSPINFTSMISLIKDTTAENIVSNVFQNLAKISIDPSAFYNDSPQTIQTALSNGGNTFVNQNSGTKIDMYLVPSKSIDTTLTLNNSADWIINFYSSSKSLVLWIHSNSGMVTKLSGN
jgi:hypothetical protein